MNEKPKEEKFNQEGERFLSDNQYKIIVGIFGIALAISLVYASIYIIEKNPIIMRKRSGAIDSHNLEAYVKLATLSQSKDSLFYSNDSMTAENYDCEEKSLKGTTSRKMSENVDRSNERVSPASSSVKTRKNTTFDFNWSFKDREEKKEEKKGFEDLNSSRTFSNLTSEEQNPVHNKIITKQIMVIGAAQTGKKSLVYSLFGDKGEDTTGNDLSSREPCFDLVVKSEDLTQNERYIFKFWIQNLSNEIYDKIIDVYYKTMNMFIFIYNVSDRASFQRIEEHYNHTKSLAKTESLNCLLVGMHFSPKHKIEVTYEEANQFAEKRNFLGFLVTSRRNSAVNKNIYEIMRNLFGISSGDEEGNS